MIQAVKWQAYLQSAHEHNQAIRKTRQNIIKKGNLVYTSHTHICDICDMTYVYQLFNLSRSRLDTPTPAWATLHDKA